MKIEHIYIACYKYDIHFTRILIASIRFWYPAIPISLIKDELYGLFDTSELHTLWDVGVFETSRKKFGWGFGKLEVLLAIPKGQRCLILDSDTVFVGPVLEVLEQCNEDFIVSYDNLEKANRIEEAYFKLAGIKKLDPAFSVIMPTFNTGQIVVTGGLIERSCLERYIFWGDTISLRYPDIFYFGEQGLLNYILMKMFKASLITMRGLPFMDIPDGLSSKQIDIKKLVKNSPYKFIIHWRGLRPSFFDLAFGKSLRTDILIHFEKLYYQKLFLGWCRRWIRYITIIITTYVKKIGKVFIKKISIREDER